MNYENRSELQKYLHKFINLAYYCKNSHFHDHSFDNCPINHTNIDHTDIYNYILLTPNKLYVIGFNEKDYSFIIPISSSSVMYKFINICKLTPVRINNEHTNIFSLMCNNCYENGNYQIYDLSINYQCIELFLLNKYKDSIIKLIPKCEGGTNNCSQINGFTYEVTKLLHDINNYYSY